MIKLTDRPVEIKNSAPVPFDGAVSRDRTIAYSIFAAHNSSKEKGRLSLKFDRLISHDITYVGIIQTARASGLESFPVPYVLTNCHNSLCAVGGTINEDDHVFGLSAARRYGGIYVPANLAVIHQYARERLAFGGGMILGSDSHTRYGALGTMGVGEGGPEIVRQLLENTYDIKEPEVILCWLTGRPSHGVGPQDVAIALCGAVYDNGFVKNRIIEFAGPGAASLPMDYRMGVDVMTTETACLSSVWETDGRVKDWYAAHGRAEDYKELRVMEGAQYDGLIEIDLGKVEPMAALPFHPSKAVTLRELIAEPGDILRECEKRTGLDLVSKIKNGKLRVDQGVIAGCAGGMYDNIAEAAAIIKKGSVGDGYFSLSVYPSSIPINMELLRTGVQASLLESGAVFKPAFCGPCFGAGDVPSNGALSIRHTTRNFPNREGSKPADGQISSVMLMDARSIAATAANGGVLTSAADFDYEAPAEHEYRFDPSSYEKRVYNGYGRPDLSEELRFGPNIKPWPEIPPLPENLVLRLDSVIHDPVTTTDELIPSGETSSYRSNPFKLAEFTLSRRDPGYVERTKETASLSDSEKKRVLAAFGLEGEALFEGVIYATSPGDGSAREQAASCQRVLGGGANICREFATKRYRSNCINWGMLPLEFKGEFKYSVGDYILLKNVRRAVSEGRESLEAVALHGGAAETLSLEMPNLTEGERAIILAGCLMNRYREMKR
ncbi:MAG: hydratase [Oscillospiraceae bacterium]|nr:hydratase [Oscillospiraceae bacterium]